MSIEGLLQVSTLVPPSPDGIGGAAFKLHSLLSARRIPTSIITSKDQEKSDGVFCEISKWTVRSFAGIMRIVRRNDVRNVIIHYPSPRFYRYVSVCFLPLYLRAKGVETTLFLHEFVSYSIIGKSRSILIMLWCRRIITVDSPNFAALSRFPFLKNRISLLPTGSNFRKVICEQPECAKTRHFSTWRGEKRKLLFFGFVQQGKGLDVALDTFERSDYLRSRFEFRVVGGNAAVRKQPEERLLERIRKSKFIAHEDYLSENDLQEVFQATDVFLLPFADGVSERRTSFMTGMWFGKSVVTTKPAVPIEGLVHMDTVILMDELSGACLEKTLIDVSHLDDEKLRAIGKRAEAWYTENFSDQRLVDKLLSILGMGNPF
jgi:glycosyltransferase involved in cell wall biosynthesis